MPASANLSSLVHNEPVLSYIKGSPERAALEQALKEVARFPQEVPVLAGDQEIHSRSRFKLTMPHAHQHVLAEVHQARPKDVEQAIAHALEIAPSWQALPFEERAAVFLRAADQITGPLRAKINATCMLQQSKTAHQSEIDAVCELADFFRFNVAFAQKIFEEQPLSIAGNVNRMDYRALEGFVLAITPFNFLAIALNLPTAPALLGNTVLWKPSNTTALGAWTVLQILHNCGLPKGVISFLPGEGPAQAGPALANAHLAGIHFTGSTRTFQHLWQEVAQRLPSYRSFPRLVGETGGKGFMVVHRSAAAPEVVTAALRGAYEFQGQKCSAASRLYIPKSLATKFRDSMIQRLKTIRVGDVRDFQNFMGAVIDKKAFTRITNYVSLAKKTATVHFGARLDNSEGWFIEPTLVEVSDPKHRLMQEEIFGPVLTFYVYDDARWSELLTWVNDTSPYALTGAVFANDRTAVMEAQQALRFAAGNFYINDKPTGAVVAQQPFGGARASGTNDKAGSSLNLLRWLCPRAIKETLVPPTDYRYPFLK